MIDRLLETGRNCGMEISVNKPKVMEYKEEKTAGNHRVKPRPRECSPIQILRKFSDTGLQLQKGN